MPDSITSLSASALLASTSSETVPASQLGGSFTLSKTVSVVATTGATDVVDLSPQAQDALQAFLSGVAPMGERGATTSPGAGVAISVTSAAAATSGYQPDYAQASVSELSWTTADGQSGSLAVEEEWSLTTDLQLVPLGPGLAATGTAPGVSVSGAIGSLGAQQATLPAMAISGTEAKAPSRDAADAADAALLILEQASPPRDDAPG